MPIFYILHQLPIWLDLEPGKRNARIFIFGMVGWVLLYGLIYHFKVQSHFLDWLYYGMMVIFLADVAVMGWTYRAYYGRSIMHELDPDDAEAWKLNTDTHQYEKVPPTTFEIPKIPEQTIEETPKPELEIPELEEVTLEEAVPVEAEPVELEAVSVELEEVETIPEVNLE